MPSKDFDIESLAAYLHIDPQKVWKMAERGKIPGRKIGGQWRFAEAEIHHWLEEQIVRSDSVELVEMESVLARHPGAKPTAVSISEKLPLDAIAVPLQAKTRNSVIVAMTDLAMATGLLWDNQKMARAVREREDLHPTALDNGVALLHPRRPLPSILAESFLALGRTYQGIPFGGQRGSLTDIFFLICSRSDQGHLRMLARLSRLLVDAEFLAGVRQAENATAMHHWVAQREQELFGET